MKKCLIIILSLIVFIFIFFKLSSDRSETNEYFTIIEDQSYYYNEKEEINFTFYSKEKDTIIDNTLKNTYQLCFETNKYILENVTINSFKSNDFYAHIIKGNILIPFINEDSKCDLEIITSNKKIVLHYGNILLSSNDLPLLEYENFSGCYSYINGELLLVGINISLNNKYQYLAKGYINSNINLDLTKTQFDKVFPNEVDIISQIPSYNILSDFRYNPIELKTHTLFIPIIYKKLTLVKSISLTLELDKELYRTSNLPLIMNTVDINNYKYLSIKGEVIYG